MRRGTVGSFVLGFLVGMVALAVGLWFAGDLRTPATARWWQSHPTAQHATPSPATAQHAT